ncbi:hypothetical protein BAG01nite_41500 [Brevibacillus agri]|uniref:DDE Tnp4 domain-containing protein n=1 Tax=Brevibacillus agri TaxID=51101 RepID=A0ABQ0SWR6_9BACL|nr:MULTISPECIES: hypothetical protein [Brevibacillus]MCG5253922.1 hypothetical protein [Brevibacillus agri]MDN4094822.1 hypothetical protein [Brevibacillus agri]MED1822540.1 hypothetical protein [Brevibacillus agri]QHZ58566.1 hypothetical protein M655_024630 [Brevibacillus sp. NSP2.1]GED28048.1 hypothetical protein BAG01nite_41500 [Brevibacillus agri]
MQLNPNSTAPDRVQAFVDTFKRAAEDASDECYGLPVKLILAMGGRVRLGNWTTQRDNQNWSNMKYVSSTNPPGNLGKGKNGWAVFCGRTSHAKSFANFFIKNARYSGLIDYLQFTNSPSPTKCLRFIADAGYGGADALLLR